MTFLFKITTNLQNLEAEFSIMLKNYPNKLLQRVFDPICLKNSTLWLAARIADIGEDVLLLAEFHQQFLNTWLVRHKNKFNDLVSTGNKVSFCSSVCVGAFSVYTVIKTMYQNKLNIDVRGPVSLNAERRFLKRRKLVLKHCYNVISDGKMFLYH